MNLSGKHHRKTYTAKRKYCSEFGDYQRKRAKLLCSVVCVAVIVAVAVSVCGCGSAARRNGDASKNGWLDNETAVVFPDVEPEYVMTYADNQAEHYPTTQGAYRFAQLVNEKSEGRIRVRVYADGELGEEGSVADQVVLGGVDFARVSLVTLEEYSDMINILLLPYLYRNSDHMWKVLDGDIGVKVMNSFEGTGLVPLSWYDAGVRNFYFRNAVKSLEGIKGLEIRVQESPVVEGMVRVLGATPVPMAYEDVYEALETGTVDGAENNWSSYESMGHWEAAPYVLEDEHMRIPELQIASETMMSQLSSEDQEMIREAARESAYYERELWEKHEEEAREAMLSKGVEVTAVSDDEKRRAQQTVTPLYERYCGDYMNLVEEIEEMGEED